MVVLEHQADGLRTHPRPRGIVQSGQIHAIDQHAAAIGTVETADAVEHRALAASRRPDDGEGLAGIEGKADAVEHRDGAIALGQGADIEQHVVDLG